MSPNSLGPNNKKSSSGSAFHLAAMPDRAPSTVPESPITKPGFVRDEVLAAEIVMAAVEGGRISARLPAGRRGDVVHLLTHLVAAPERLDAYCTALEADRERRGPEVELRLLGMGGLDIPDKQIAAGGFAGLSDDHLADIALSPSALRAISDYLEDPETRPGLWFYEAINEVEAARPDDAELARRTSEIFERLKGSGDFSPQGSEKGDRPDRRILSEEDT